MDRRQTRAVFVFKIMYRKLFLLIIEVSLQVLKDDFRQRPSFRSLLPMWHKTALVGGTVGGWGVSTLRSTFHRRITISFPEESPPLSQEEGLLPTSTVHLPSDFLLLLIPIHHLIRVLHTFTKGDEKNESDNFDFGILDHSRSQHTWSLSDKLLNSECSWERDSLTTLSLIEKKTECPE